MKYFAELKRSMEYLAQDRRVVFLGQAVAEKGTAVTNTLQGVSCSQLLELPVAEEMQMGMATGMALAGLIPVTIYPRFNFVLLAMNQLVNHLDRMQEMAGINPKVIVRTVIGSVRPLDPQCQHVGDFTDAFTKLCPHIHVIRLDEPEDIFPAYVQALYGPGSSLLIEHGDFYNEK